MENKQTLVSVQELTANCFNANVMSPENEQKLDEAIKRFGFFKPIVVREVTSKNVTKLEILGGEHRWESAKRLGMTEVPIFNLGPIDDQRAKEISLADNARYGFDDAAALADILKDIGEQEEIQNFLPYSDTDLRSIFDSSSIALDELELDTDFDRTSDPVEQQVAKAPKTHAMMRFKVSLKDAEKITDLIARVQKRHGYTTADDLTNAGDALTHILFAIPDEEE